MSRLFPPLPIFHLPTFSLEDLELFPGTLLLALQLLDQLLISWIWFLNPNTKLACSFLVKNLVSFFSWQRDRSTSSSCLWCLSLDGPEPVCGIWILSTPRSHSSTTLPPVRWREMREPSPAPMWIGLKLRKLISSGWTCLVSSRSSRI